MSYIQIVLTVFSLIVVILAIWLVPLYKRLVENEKLIRAKENEIDAVENDVNARTSGTLTNESQRVAQIANKRRPLQRQLERLKQERQFIIDKLPFFKH